MCRPSHLNVNSRHHISIIFRILEINLINRHSKLMVQFLLSHSCWTEFEFQSMTKNAPRKKFYWIWCWFTREQLIRNLCEKEIWMKLDSCIKRTFQIEFFGRNVYVLNALHCCVAAVHFLVIWIRSDSWTTSSSLLQLCTFSLTQHKIHWNTKN